MTVATTLNKIIYSGNASATSFAFSFAFPGGTATQEAVNFQVYYTDLNGNVTLLVQGVTSSNYQITFNAPIGTDPTPVGGSVTYNPPGGPIAIGTFLTILRVLSLTQSTSLANQGTLYQPVVESALDYQVMVSQQILEVQSRALMVAVSDPTPTNLPAVAARKNLFFAFDSNGNPIASQPGGSNTPISSAMVPVVTASTLSAAQTALGLGNIAPTNAGAGLFIGGGVTSVLSPMAVDSTSQSVVLAFHLSTREVSANITYTLLQSSTLFSGFFFTINTRGFQVTLTPFASDSIDGLSTGSSLVLPAGVQVTIVTNASGTWYMAIQSGLTGINAPLNVQLSASVASNALTITVLDRNGNNPSPSSPVVFTVSAGGNSTQRTITTALSITVPSGATLGTANAVASRIWVGIFDNAGSPVLGVYYSVSGLGGSAISVVPWNEALPASPTAISSGSTSAQTWYASSGLTTKAFRVLGYIEATEATAGTWATAPSTVQLFGPGIKKPGDIISVANSAAASLALSLVSACSLTDYIATCYVSVTGAPPSVTVTFSANSGTLQSLVVANSVGAPGTVTSPIAFSGCHVSNATSDTYTISGGTPTNAHITLKEIQT